MRVLGPIEIRSAQILIFFGACRSEVFQAARLAAGRRPVADGAGPEEVDSWTLNVATRLWHKCVICGGASPYTRELSTCLLHGVRQAELILLA